MILNLFRRSVSAFALTDIRSEVDRKARVGRGCKLIASSLGRFSYVGSGSVLAYTRVGKFCSIASGCRIGLAGHTLSYLSNSPLFTSPRNGTGSTWCCDKCFEEYLPVTVGNDVWIGTDVLVRGGVAIGDGAVVGAGAVVTHDVPPYAVVCGVPARTVRFRFPPETVERLLALRWWDAPDERLRSAIELFRTDAITEALIDELEKHLKS